MYHAITLWGEQHQDGPCSDKQARFVASLWGSCFEGTQKSQSQDYHTCLGWLFPQALADKDGSLVSSASGLTRGEAHEVIDWLFSGEYVKNENDKDVPVLNENAVEETRRVLRQALKEKGQQELPL